MEELSNTHTPGLDDRFSSAEFQVKMLKLYEKAGLNDAFNVHLPLATTRSCSLRKRIKNYQWWGRWRWRRSWAATAPRW